MNIGLFIGLNIVVVFALSVMYFLTKEIIRVTPKHREIFV
jgi:hypothetical protein